MAHIRQVIGLLLLTVLLAACGSNAEVDYNNQMNEMFSGLDGVSSIGSIDITTGENDRLALDAELNVPSTADLQALASDITTSIQEIIPTGIDVNIRVNQGDEVSILEGSLGGEAESELTISENN